MWQVASGGFLGWALGANDASNVFGTAVASRMLRFRTAAILCSVFVLVGAVVGGSAGMRTYQAMSSTTLDTAFVVGMASAVTVTVMTWKNLPVSTSQAVVGALIAAGMFGGRFDVSVLGKVVVCWVGTPLGALVVAALLYVLLGKVLNWLDLDMFQYDQWLRWALIVAGSYGAYALGANNVANVTGAFVGEGMLSVPTACLIGGLAIGLGVITNSRGVMMTVGQGLVKLDAFSAFIVVLAEAITVHIYAMVGVPVSTSQAVVGGVLGVGLVRGVRTVNRKVLRDIVLAWLTTPVFGFAGAYACFWAGRQLGWL